MARTVGKRKVRLEGNSLVVTIPVKVCKELNIEEGDLLEFRVNYKTNQVELRKHE